jgi:Mg2+ and Co2+ transporter CorA
VKIDKELSENIMSLNGTEHSLAEQDQHYTTAQLRNIIRHTRKIMSLRNCSADKSQINNSINKEDNVPASLLEYDP